MKKFLLKSLAFLAVFAVITGCDKKHSTSDDDDDDDENTAKTTQSEYERMLAEQGYSADNPTLVAEEIPQVTELEIVEEIAASQAVTELKIVDENKVKKEIKDIEDILGAEDLNKNAVKAEIVESAPAPAAEKKEESPVSMAMVEQKPQFPGGDAEMYKWLAEHINYPVAAAEAGVQGKVTVQLIIEKDGTISNVKVIRGKDPSLDQEAVRVVKAMPKWNPGRNNGQPVRVTYLLPVSFKLQQ